MISCSPKCLVLAVDKTIWKQNSCSHCSFCVTVSENSVDVGKVGFPWCICIFWHNNWLSMQSDTSHCRKNFSSEQFSTVYLHVFSSMYLLLTKIWLFFILQNDNCTITVGYTNFYRGCFSLLFGMDCAQKIIINQRWDRRTVKKCCICVDCCWLLLLTVYREARKKRDQQRLRERMEDAEAETRVNQTGRLSLFGPAFQCVYRLSSSFHSSCCSNDGVIYI